MADCAHSTVERHFLAIKEDGSLSTSADQLASLFERYAILALRASRTVYTISWRRKSTLSASAAHQARFTKRHSQLERHSDTFREAHCHTQKGMHALCELFAMYYRTDLHEHTNMDLIMDVRVHCISRITTFK